MKKAIFMKAFNLFIAIAVISLLFFGFFSIFGLFTKQSEKKIEALKLKYDYYSLIINFLKIPYSENESIIDAILNNRDITTFTSKYLEGKLKYKIYLDKNLIASSTELPREIIKIEFLVPKNENEINQIIFEIQK